MPRGMREADHPGCFIREHVIPAGIPVKEAAKRLGVGRPALSNLLNGNSSLSPEMAVRLDKAFGADGNELLERQREFDRTEANSGEEREIVVRPYVPPFLQIKSRQIDAWADPIKARHLLPVLLRLADCLDARWSEPHDVSRPRRRTAARMGRSCWRPIRSPLGSPRGLRAGSSGRTEGRERRPTRTTELRSGALRRSRIEGRRHSYSSHHASGMTRPTGPPRNSVRAIGRR